MAGTCMAEMKNADDAQNTIQFLRGCKIFGNELEFTFSRNEVSLCFFHQKYKFWHALEYFTSVT